MRPSKPGAPAQFSVKFFDLQVIGFYEPSIHQWRNVMRHW